MSKLVASHELLQAHANVRVCNCSLARVSHHQRIVLITFCYSKKTSPTSAMCICCRHNATFTCATTSGRRSMLTNAQKKRLPQHKHRHTHTHVVTLQHNSQMPTSTAFTSQKKQVTLKNVQLSFWHCKRPSDDSPTQ